ncbi:MAG: 2-phospho-L-lactate guanylyltransferase [Candidatus Binatia bacterium]
MKVSALIPARGFEKAKRRLAPLLTAAEREILAEAMLRDVLQQVISARGIEGVFVVTADAGVAQVVSSLGSRVIREQEERGESEAVAYALAVMKEYGVQSTLVVPGDIPLLRSGDIEFILEQVHAEVATSPLALLVPSHDRMGTNALLLSPHDVIRLRFGYDSFCRHLSEVAAKGLPLRVLENERIALDIDEPEDLERLLSARGKGEVYRRLLCMEAAEPWRATHPGEGL